MTPERPLARSQPRLRRVAAIATLLLLGSGEALADGEVLVLAPIAALGFAAGGVTGCIAGYIRASSALFVLALAAYGLLSLLAAAAWADSPEAFLFSVMYTLLVGMGGFAIAYFLLRQVGRAMRRRKRQRHGSRPGLKRR
jgi:peptidoglycan/LPS O-acetylase OafA/YrhL